MADFPKDVAQQLKALEKMGAPELRALWRTTFGKAHPGWVQRDFLRRALAYHFQEKAYGGLREVVQRRLSGYADEVSLKGHTIVSLARAKLKAGTRLVRSWGGATHVVTALNSDFEYHGRRYKSLSEIARLITKTRWSGPAFFGLKAKGGLKDEDRGTSR